MARSRLDVLGHSGLTPLMGREQEVGLLRSRWEHVKDGRGQVVLLSGEAGIGKSRLVQELKAHVATEPQAWLTPCQCSPYHQHSVLYPLMDLLERVVLQFDRQESPEHKRSKLEGLLVQHDYASYLHYFRREEQDAQEQAEAAMGLASEKGFPQFVAVGTITRGWALAMQGQGEEGIAQLHQGMAAFRAAAGDLDRPRYLAHLAEAYGQVGQREEGLTALAEALATAHHSGDRYWEAELHRLQGELLLQQPVVDAPEAETCFRQALDITRRQQAKSLELRAAMSLSRVTVR